MSVEKVWVVDDDRSIRWVLERALAKEGLTSCCFENASAVLSRLEREQPEVIISDIRMAGMRTFVLYDSQWSSYSRSLLSMTGCPSSQIAIVNSAAVPLWKVMVGPRAD